MLLRLTYLAVTNVVALLRLLPVSDRDKDAEILALRQQITRPGTAAGQDPAAVLPRRHAARSRPRHPGRPRTIRSIRLLVLRLANENPCWGYPRIHGELLVLGIKVALSTVREILRDAGTDPAPDRTTATWASFLRDQASALLACDFFEAVTAAGVHLFVQAVIEHATRRIRILGTTPPDRSMGRPSREEPGHSRSWNAGYSPAAANYLTGS